MDTMDKINATVTGEALATLKCESCDNYLSSFPIYLSQDNKNVCGRCAKEAQNDLTRNVKYEVLAQFVKFPCRFKKDGCPNLVFAENVSQHEEKCGYASEECPIKTIATCNWKGKRMDLLFHCHKHPNNVFWNSEFKVNLIKSYKCGSLAEYKGHLFLMIQHYNSEKLTLGIIMKKLETGKEFPCSECSICFKSDNMITFIKYSFNAIKIIDLRCLKDDLKDSTELSAQIYYDETCFNSSVNTHEVENPLPKEIISKFTCSLCYNYLLPPICYLPSENVVCCQCLIDTSSTLHFRDRKLEEIANLLNFPCIYNNKGCCFVAKPEELEIHLMCCPYGDYECPLSDFINCEWFGLGRDIKSHIYEIHADLFLTSMVVNVVVEGEMMISNQIQTFGAAATFPSTSYSPAPTSIGSPVSLRSFFGSQNASSILEELSPNTGDSPIKSTPGFLKTTVHNPAFSSFRSPAKRACSSGVGFPTPTVSTIASSIECSSKDTSSPSVVFPISTMSTAASSEGCSSKHTSSPNVVSPSQTVSTTASSAIGCLSKDISSQNVVFPSPTVSITASSLGCSSKDTSSQSVVFPISTAASSVGCSSKQTNSPNFVFRAPILSSTVSSSTGCPTTPANSSNFPSQTAIMSTATSSIRSTIKTYPLSRGKRLLKAMRCIRSNRKRDFSELNAKPQNETIARCYIINFSNKLFRLLFCKTNSVFSWYVQMIGDYEKGYIFEIEIVNKKDPISCIILRGPCTDIKDKKELFSVKNKKGCFLLEEQVANFLDNNEICFKVKLDIVNP